MADRTLSTTIAAGADTASATPPPDGDRRAPGAPPLPRLQGPWLLLGRVGWLAAVGFVVVLLVALLPAYNAGLTTPCTHPNLPCVYWFTTAGAGEVHALGLSPEVLAIAHVAVRLLVILVWVGTGGLLVWRRSDDPMALFVACVLVLAGTYESLIPGNPVPLLLIPHPEWRLPFLALGFLGESCIILFGFLFPTGRFVPRWTRWLALAFIAEEAVDWFLPDSPLSIGHWPAAAQVANGLLFSGAFIAAQVYRYRRVSSPLERQQTKWVVFPAVLALLVGSEESFRSLVSPASTFLLIEADFIVLILAILVVPVGITVAVLRYRLYGIDAIVHRTLVYTLLTAILALVVQVSEQVLQLVVLQQTGQQQTVLASIMAALLIAALFNPLQRGLQLVVGRIVPPVPKPSQGPPTARAGPSVRGGTETGGAGPGGA